MTRFSDHTRYLVKSSIIHNLISAGALTPADMPNMLLYLSILDDDRLYVELRDSEKLKKDILSKDVN